MRIAFMVNDVFTEQPGYTTIRMAMAATNRGHDVWIMGAGDFAYDTDERIHARARAVPKNKYKLSENYLKDLHGPSARSERITVDDLDVLMLRSDPSIDTGLRFWAQNSGIIFGRAAMQAGVVVLNDPNGLSRAMNKMYFQLFPEEVRPTTIITRDRDEIKNFASQGEGKIVIKPLQGSGGQGVFLVQSSELANLNQMIESVCRDGYVIAQEYLPEAINGDTRLFVMNGLPFKYKGKYCAFRRVRSGDDMRSNVHAGGKIQPATITPEMLNIVEIVRPKLVQDGMFLVGLDIVGDKLMEVNVFSPGGVGSAQKMEGVNFAHAIIQSLEQKVGYMSFYKRNFDNVDMACL